MLSADGKKEKARSSKSLSRAVVRHRKSCASSRHVLMNRKGRKKLFVTLETVLLLLLLNERTRPHLGDNADGEASHTVVVFFRFS